MAADFDGDGKPDVAVANGVGDTVSVYLGNGDGTFGAAHNYPSGGATSALELVDINSDSHLDLVAAHYLDNSVSLLFGNSDGSFQPPIMIPAVGNPQKLASADFNGDGKPDLAVSEADVYATTGASALVILRSNGDGTFRAPINYGYLGAVAVGHCNSDAAVDIAGASGLSVSVLIGKGNGTFIARTDYAVGSYPSAVATADLNHDGKLDLAISCVSVLAPCHRLWLPFHVTHHRQRGRYCLP